jgi:hypothetical protein
MRVRTRYPRRGLEQATVAMAANLAVAVRPSRGEDGSELRNGVESAHGLPMVADDFRRR